MKSITHAPLFIGQGFEIEVEGRVVDDDARGATERIVDGDITVKHRSGRRIELAGRYERRAVAALVEAADREDDDAVR